MALPGRRTETIQEIILNNMDDYTDLASKDFKKKCCKQLMEIIPQCSPARASAWYNATIYGMRHLVSTAHLVSTTLEDSQTQKEQIQDVVDSLKEDFDSQDSSDDEYVSKRASLGGNIVKAIGTQTKITTNILGAAALLHKQDVDSEKVEIMKVRNDILNKETDNVAEQIKIQMDDFRKLQNSISYGNSIDIPFKAVITDGHKNNILPED